MIREDKGRARSERTPNEQLQILQQELKSLSPEEREALLLALKEMENGLVEEGAPTLLDTFAKVEWERQPVDVETFVKDEYYLGKTCDNLYPKLLEDLKELFSGGYHECVFTGAIGTGKTFFSSIGVCRLLYELSCMRDPQSSYGLAPGSIIAIVAFSVNEMLAMKVVFENIVNKLQASPYFKEHLPYEITKKEMRFPGKKLWLAARASTDSSALGLNTIGALIDETNFMPDVPKNLRGRMGAEIQGRAQSIYNTIKRRMKSRFSRQGQLPGMLFIVSSKKTRDDFTAKLIRVMKNDPSMFVRDYCLTGDTKVPLLDGTTKTLEELAKQYAGSEEFFDVYSLDTKTGRVVPGRAHHPRLTARNELIVKVTLDNGESVRATPWHPFLLRSGEYRRADALRPGDSLMPLYRRLDAKGYEELGQPVEGGRWWKTHRVVARAKFGSWSYRGKDGLPTVIHHVNHDKRDNRPDNLILMEWTAHQQHHRDAMDRLLAYVRTPEHRAYASSHMRALHQDPVFARARDERGAKAMRAMRADPIQAAKMAAIAGQALSSFHKTPLGRVRQRERNFKRWEGKRKILLSDIEQAALEGIAIAELALRHGCTPSAIVQILKRAGRPTYGALKQQHGHFSPKNHRVVSVVPVGVADVYDLSVETYENFALAAGVFVHNSQWDVLPGTRFTANRFPVLCGNENTPSKILTADEAAVFRARELDEGLVILDVPEEFRPDFENDLEGSIRDIGGISTVALSPFIQRREKIMEAVDSRLVHPFSSLEYEIGTSNTFEWGKMVRAQRNRLGETIWQPLINPAVPRHVHIDPSLTSDCTGFAMAHIAGQKDVVRRKDGKAYTERLPIFLVDLVLRIRPPTAGEIDLGDVRQLIFMLREHGYRVTHLTMDRWNSADTLQQIRKRGMKAEVLSVDVKPEPYEHLKTALYEGRVFMYDYPPLLQELQQLEKDHGKNKIDHPLLGSKDIADALAGVLFSLSQTRSVGATLPILPGISYSPKDVAPNQMGFSGSSRGLSILMGVGAGMSDDDEGWTDL